MTSLKERWRAEVTRTVEEGLKTMRYDKDKALLHLAVEAPQAVLCTDLIGAQRGDGSSRQSSDVWSTGRNG